MSGTENNAPATSTEAPSEAAILSEGADDFTKAAIEAALADEKSAANAEGFSAGEETADEEDVGGEETSEEAAPKAERPENIPEKFWDAEKGEVRWDDLAKAYSELEKKQGTTTKAKEEGAEEAPEGKEEPPEGEKTEEETAEQEETVQEVLNTKEFTEEFQKTGDLSKESRAKAAERLKTVFGDEAAEMVDGYVEGLQLRADKAAADIKALVGGGDEYQKLAAWAMENLSPEEQAAFDKEVTSNAAAARIAVRELHLRYKEAGGSEALPDIQHGKGGKSGEDVYSSMDEIYADQDDPRYSKDEGFRRKVDAKIARSTAR